MWGYAENRATRDKIVRGELARPAGRHGQLDPRRPGVPARAPVTQGRRPPPRAAPPSGPPEAEGADFVKVYFVPGRRRVRRRSPPSAAAPGLPFAGHWPYRVPQPTRRGRAAQLRAPLRAARSPRRAAATSSSPRSPRHRSTRRPRVTSSTWPANSTGRPRRRTTRRAGPPTSPGSTRTAARLSPTLAVNRVILGRRTRSRTIRGKVRPAGRSGTPGPAQLQLFGRRSRRRRSRSRTAYFHAQLELVGAAHRAGRRPPRRHGLPEPVRLPGLQPARRAGPPGRRRARPAAGAAGGDPRRGGVPRPGGPAGTIDPGKVADLVLLDADPLADIRAVRRIDTVVTAGRVFDRMTLDRMLADVESARAGPPDGGRPGQRGCRCTAAAERPVPRPVGAGNPRTG